MTARKIHLQHVHAHTCTLMRTHARTHSHMRTYARTHTHAHAHTRAHTHTHTHARTHAHTHTQTRTHKCTQTRTHKCTQTRTHTNTHTNKQTNKQTNTHTLPPLQLAAGCAVQHGGPAGAAAVHAPHLLLHDDGAARQPGPRGHRNLQGVCLCVWGGGLGWPPDRVLSRRLVSLRIGSQE